MTGQRALLFTSLGLRGVDGVLLWTVLREDRPPRARVHTVLADGGRTVREAVGLLRVSTALSATSRWTTAAPTPPIPPVTNATG